MSRPRYQNGSLKRMPRKGGPDVWVYRWRETDQNGARQSRKRTIGTVHQYPTRALASEAITSLRSRANRAGAQLLGGPRTFSELIKHYRLKELPEENHDRKRKKTKKSTRAT